MAGEFVTLAGILHPAMTRALGEIMKTKEILATTGRALCIVAVIAAFLWLINFLGSRGLFGYDNCDSTRACTPVEHPG